MGQFGGGEGVEAGHCSPTRAFAFLIKLKSPEITRSSLHGILLSCNPAPCAGQSRAVWLVHGCEIG